LHLKGHANKIKISEKFNYTYHFKCTGTLLCWGVLGSRYVGCLFCSLSPCPRSSAPERRQSKVLAVGCSDPGVRQIYWRTDELRNNEIYLHSNKHFPASRAASQVAFASVKMSNPSVTTSYRKSSCSACVLAPSSLGRVKEYKRGNPHTYCQDTLGTQTPCIH